MICRTAKSKQATRNGVSYPAMSKQATENNGFRSIQEHAERMFEKREMFCLFACFGPFCIFDFDMILVGGALEKNA